MNALVLPRPTRRVHAALMLLIAAAGGVLLGVLDLVAQTTLPYPWANLANSSAVWAVAAFAVGRWSRLSVRWAAAAGAITLWVAVEAYYVATVVALHDSVSVLTAPTTLTWLVFAGVAGVLFGAAGARSRGTDVVWAAGGTALPASVLYAEAIVGLNDRGHGVQTAVLEAASGILVLLVAGRTNRQRVIALLMCLPLTALGYVAFTSAGFGG